MSKQLKLLFLLYSISLLQYVHSKSKTKSTTTTTTSSPTEPKSCNATLQCTSSTIKETELSCDGFLGCTDSEISSDRVTCDGAYSCLQSSIETKSYLQCHGKSACYNTTKAYSDGAVSCHGQYGCAWSKNLSSATMGVNCGGYMSCMHANITATGVIVANGERALTNADIDSEDAMIWFSGKEGLVIEAKGYLSGSGANLYCRKDTQCTVRCEGSGCANMNIYCFDGSECIVEPERCGDNQPLKQGEYEEDEGVQCPNLYLSESEEEDKTLNGLIVTREISRISVLEKWMEYNEEYRREEYYRNGILKRVKVIEDDNLRRYYNNLDGIISVSIVLILVFIAFCAYHTVSANQQLPERGISKI